MGLFQANEHPSNIKAQRDAFGRLRISQPITLFDSKLLVADQPTLFWDDQQVSGSGTSSAYLQLDARVRLSVSASTAGRRVRQTFRSFPYQPGKSQLLTMTFNAQGGVANVTKRLGLFNDSDGLFFQMNGTTPSFVVRKAGSDRIFSQSQWNGDRLDGSGFSGNTFDATKCQILFIDFQWLGTGEVRFGFIIGNQTIVCHEVYHSNVATSVYISTPNLPIRYEIANSGAGSATSMDCICCSLNSEAGQEDNGLEFSADLSATPFATLNNAVLYPVLGLRLKSTHLGAYIKIKSYNILCDTNSTYRAAMCFNPTLAGTAVSWSGITNSALEVSRPTNGTTVSAEGSLVNSSYAIQTNNSTSGTVEIFGGFLTLGSSISGVSDQLWLCVARLAGGTESFYASIRWRETI